MAPELRCRAVRKISKKIVDHVFGVIVHEHKHGNFTNVRDFNQARCLKASSGTLVSDPEVPVSIERCKTHSEKELTG
jgi:hypothetical protein